MCQGFGFNVPRQMEKTADNLTEMLSQLQGDLARTKAALEPRLAMARKFTTQQEILTNNIAAARKACPVRPNK